MTPRRLTTLAAATLSILVALPAAMADEDERRLSLSGTAALVSLDAFDTTNTTEAYGGSLAAAWGIRNWLDLGADASYLTRPNALLENATLGPLGGDGFDVYADLHDIQLAATARFIFEGGPFYRIRPIAGLRAGLDLRILARPELYEPNGGYVLTEDTDITLAPFAGAEAGVSWRLSETLQLATIATATVADKHESYGLQLELSWFSYTVWQ